MKLFSLYSSYWPAIIVRTSHTEIEMLSMLEWNCFNLIEPMFCVNYDNYAWFEKRNRERWKDI